MPPNIQRYYTGGIYSQKKCGGELTSGQQAVKVWKGHGNYKILGKRVATTVRIHVLLAEAQNYNTRDLFCVASARYR